jgi:hypothetical protein
MRKWLRQRWNRRRRRIDMQVLWPACLKNAPTLDHAKAAFAQHVFHDTAWAEFSPRELYAFIDGLIDERH